MQPYQLLATAMPQQFNFHANAFGIELFSVEKVSCIIFFLEACTTCILDGV